jgi:hypothetical protein
MYLGSLLSVRGQRILDKLGPHTHTHTHRQTFSGSNPPPKTPPGKKNQQKDK